MCACIICQATPPRVCPRVNPRFLGKADQRLSLPPVLDFGVSNLAQTSKTVVWGLCIFPPPLPGNTGPSQSQNVALRGPGAGEERQRSTVNRDRPPSDGVSDIIPKAVIRHSSYLEKTRKRRGGIATVEVGRLKDIFYFVFLLK